MEVNKWQNMKPLCWISLSPGPGRVLCPISSKKPKLGQRTKTTLNTRFHKMRLMTFLAFLNFLSSTGGPTGNMEESWVCSAMAVA